MKLTLFPRPHNCDKHINVNFWSDEQGVVERLEVCTVCNRVKNFWAYGVDYVINYKQKKKFVLKDVNKDKINF